MTEEGAKTKWCPFARYASVRGVGINRWVDEEVQLSPEPARSIASACMAWRWEGYRAEDGTWVRKVAGGRFKPENAEGYCGLAGSPQ